MITDRLYVVQDFINANEISTLIFVNVCNQICEGTTNFKRIAEKYDLKRSNKFSGSHVAKTALKCLKRIKKQHLINTVYPGIVFQLKLNQLRYLINLRYSKLEPISFEAWISRGAMVRNTFKA